MLAALLLLPLVACSPAPSPQAQTEQRERDLMGALKTQYPDVVTGFDFHGNAVDVSVDPDALLSMDEDAEAALKAASLERWKTAWTQTHKGAHATITLRLIDYRGNRYYNASAKV